jgi:hypothetical protein
MHLKAITRHVKAFIKHLKAVEVIRSLQRPSKRPFKDM